MTDSERRAFATTAALLLAASALRLAVAPRAPSVFAPADSTETLSSLLEETADRRAEEDRRASSLAPGERIDPNIASDVELDRLPGVGPSLARRIVASREERGPFSSAHDLRRVRGVGEATLERIEPHLEIASVPVLRGGRRAVPFRGSDPPLDLNRATEQEFQTLRGIGPALAARIVVARTERGGFSRVDDLLDVRGIGPATLERLRPRLVVR